MESNMINFLRGVPADESLEKISPLVAEGYKEAINKYGAGVLQYGHFGGFKPLRETLANIYNTDPERIIAGNGGLEMISLFFKSLPPNSTVLMEAATYDRVVSDVAQYGHKTVGVEMTSEGVRLDDLERLLKETSATVFYGIPFHQNPTGITYTEENRNAVEEICKKQDVICLWDICYEPLRYDGSKNTPVALSDGGPVLMSSFTKTISPGTKCGYMILPKESIGRVTQVIANTRINPNLPTQAFIAEFVKSGKYDEFQKVLCDLYKPRMDALNTAVETHFPYSGTVRATGGFSVIINIPEITKEKEDLFIQSAKEAGVSIGSADAVFPPNILEKNREKGLFVRTPFPALEPEQISQGIAILKEVKQSVIGGRS